VRKVLVVVQQILVVTVAIAVVGGLVGFLIVHFGASGGFVKGVAYGMIGAGALVGFVSSQSGSPSRNVAQGRWGASGNYWGTNSALPQTPYQFVVGGLLAFGGGLALLALA
jgi:hypothetical protein